MDDFDDISNNNIYARDLAQFITEVTGFRAKARPNYSYNNIYYLCVPYENFYYNLELELENIIFTNKNEIWFKIINENSESYAKIINKPSNWNANKIFNNSELIDLTLNKFMIILEKKYLFSFWPKRY